MDFLPLLPREVVFKYIIIHLDFTSRVRAAAVSPAWRDLLHAAPRTPGFSLPWLWGKSHVRKAKPFLIDFASSAYFSIRRPSRREYVVASGSIYLTFTSDPLTRPITIWGPFTGETCQLPSTSRDLYGVRERLRDIGDIQFSSRLPNCVIAALSGRGVYLCRPGDQDWVEGLITLFSIRAMVYHKGLFYCLDSSQKISAYDFTYMVDYLNGRIPFNPTVHRCQFAPSTEDLRSVTGGICYGCDMVESNGELLVVTKFDSYDKKKTQLTVHRLDEENGKFVRVKDLGDRMLFMGSSSLAYEFSSGPSTSDSFFTKNAIYFFTDRPYCDPKIFFHHPKKNCYRLGKFLLDSEICNYHPIYAFDNIDLIWLAPPQ